MSIVIVGGNERMERQYVDICQKYKHKVKTFIKPVARLKNKIGEPDLIHGSPFNLFLFTYFQAKCLSHHSGILLLCGMDSSTPQRRC